MVVMAVVKVLLWLFRGLLGFAIVLNVVAKVLV